jgi:hypothetical protein
MEIVLIVAVLVVAAAVLYMTLTLTTRTRQSTAPLIDDAYKGVAGQVEGAAQDLKRQIAEEMQKDREQQRLDGMQVQGRLDHLDSQASGTHNQVMAELATIGRLVEQLGVRQDQLSADLGKLDHRIARLGESVARASQPQAVPAGSGPTPAGGPAIVPGQLYAERLRFSVAGVQLPSVPSRSDRRFRIQVERQIGALPGAPGDPSTLIQRAANDTGFRGQLSQAASEYFAAKPGDPVSAMVTERWATQDAYSETDLLEVCNRISSGLETIVERPVEKTGTELRLPRPGAAAATGAGAALVLQPATAPLGQAAVFLEITGVVVGLAAGFYPLALAAAKMLAHDQFHDFVARRLKEAARQVFEGPEGPADDRPPLRPVAEAPDPGQVPTIPGQNLWGPPGSKPPAKQPDPAADPDWWDDGPALGGPGAG